MRRVNDWLARRRLWVIAAIVAVSALLRVGYFLQLNDGPCIRQHRWNQSDMGFFDLWARQIAAGDLLCEHVDPPIHQWHKELADDYFQRHPAELAELQRAEAAGGPAPERVLWNRWAGGKRFYQDPLYPYLVAATYATVGDDVRWVFAWQMLVGVLTNVLIYLLARRLFGDGPAVLAAPIACFYSPILNSELVLLRATLVTFAAVGMVYLADVARSRATFAWWLAAGLAMGLSVILKAHFALFVILAGGVLVAEYFRKRKTLARCAAGLVLGAAIGASPLVVRNLAVGVAPFATATSARPAFALWNGYEPNTGVSWRPQAASRIMERVGGHDSVVWPTLRTHPGVGSLVELTARRFAAAWNWYELPDSANLYYYFMHSSVLRWMPFTFFLLAPISIVGMFLAARQARGCAFLYLQVFVNLAVLSLFFPVGRFRLPMAAALIPFAGLAVWRVSVYLASRRFGLAAAVLAAMVALGFWTGRPVPAGKHAIRLADFTVPYDIYYKARIERAVADDDWPTAAFEASRLISFRPRWLDEIGPGHPPAPGEDTRTARWFMDLHRMCGQIFLRAKWNVEARANLSRADELAAALAPRAAGR
jgi:hypothetical protein